MYVHFAWHEKDVLHRVTHSGVDLGFRPIQLRHAWDSLMDCKVDDLVGILVFSNACSITDPNSQRSGYWNLKISITRVIGGLFRGLKMLKGADPSSVFDMKMSFSLTHVGCIALFFPQRRLPTSRTFWLQKHVCCWSTIFCTTWDGGTACQLMGHSWIHGYQPLWWLFLCPSLLNVHPYDLGKIKRPHLSLSGN